MTVTSDPYPFTPTALEADLLDRLEPVVERLTADAARNDDEARIPIEGLTALQAAGFDAAVLPEHLGGGGARIQLFGRVVERLAEADPSAATIWTMHLGAAVGLAQMTTRTLGTTYADALLRGDRFANALSEPTSGNRFLNPQQEAEPTDGGFRLHGAKRYVSGSEIAQHLLVNVAVGGEPVFFGVQPDETVAVVPIWDTLGLRATRSQLVEFQGTFLADSHRGVFDPAHVNLVAPGLAHISLGVANAALRALVSHAGRRQVLGRSLAHQEWLQHEVAGAEARLQAARSYARHALRLADDGAPDALQAADRAKYLANKAAVEVAALALRAGGAGGFLRTSPIQRHHRDAQAGQLMAYSTEVLAAQLGRVALGVDG